MRASAPGTILGMEGRTSSTRSHIISHKCKRKIGDAMIEVLPYEFPQLKRCSHSTNDTNSKVSLAILQMYIM